MSDQFAVVNVYGHPDNDNMCFEHLLMKGKLWIGARDALKKMEVKSIMNDATYFIIYKPKREYGANGGWFDVYKKTDSVCHEVRTIEEWNKLTNKGMDLPQPIMSHVACKDATEYYKDGGVDYLINVVKVFNGRVDSPEQLPNQRRIQRVSNVSNINYLKEIIA